MMDDLHLRQEWYGSSSLRKPGGSPTFHRNRITHGVIHWPGNDFSPIADSADVLRRIASYRERNFSYTIDYNFGFGQRADRWQIRGFDYRNYANDGDIGEFQHINFNESSLSVLFLYDGNEPVNDVMLGAAPMFLRDIELDLGRNLTWIGHRDSDSTGCPGDQLYAKLPQIFRDLRAVRNMPKPTPKPEPEPERKDEMSATLISIEGDDAVFVLSEQGKYWLPNAGRNGGNAKNRDDSPYWAGVDLLRFTGQDAGIQTISRSLMRFFGPVNGPTPGDRDAWGVPLDGKG